MFSYVINCVNEFLSTFAELAALPIRVFVVPGLENYGIINPIVDAVELNLVVSAVMFVFLGNLCLVNVLLKQVSNYVSRKFLKNTKDESSTISMNEEVSKKSEHKPSSPFYRTRPRRNKEDRR